MNFRKCIGRGPVTAFNGFVRNLLVSGTLAAACLFPAPVPAQEKELFTPDHVARLRYVADATISPDGKSIAYVLSVPRKPGKDGIRLHTDVDPSLIVQMRPVSLQQVIINLLLNSFTALSGRRGEVYVSAVAIDPTMTQITIADTGPGIASEIQRTLFEPFVTTDRSDGPRKGSGLGLAVCRQLVQAAGGTITVQTKLGQGTAFTLRLPTANSQSLSSSVSLGHGRSSKKAA